MVMIFCVEASNVNITVAPGQLEGCPAKPATVEFRFSIGFNCVQAGQRS